MRRDVETLLLTNGGGRIEQQVPVRRTRAASHRRRGPGPRPGPRRRLRTTVRAGWRSSTATASATPPPASPPGPRAAGTRPTAPPGRWTCVLAPDQMMLQIHESIGHPLELDRILGDERNYAGTSFVTLDMFGSYRYGSRPAERHASTRRCPGELASYGFDDEGTRPSAELLIDEGVLLRPLGGAVSRPASASPASRTRGPAAGTARRSTAWPTSTSSPAPSSLDELIGQVERRRLHGDQLLWSIDDSRNKFQFGCELGRLIEDGELTRGRAQPQLPRASRPPSGGSCLASVGRRPSTSWARPTAARASPTR